MVVQYFKELNRWPNHHIHFASWISLDCGCKGMASFWKIKITTWYTVNYVLPNNWEITTKIDIDYYQIWWDARKCSPQNQPFGRKCTTNEKKEKICDIPELFVAKTDPNRLPTLDEKKGEVLNNRSRYSKTAHPVICVWYYGVGCGLLIGINQDRIWKLFIAPSGYR